MKSESVIHRHACESTRLMSRIALAFNTSTLKRHSLYEWRFNVNPQAKIHYIYSKSKISAAGALTTLSTTGYPSSS